METKRALKEYNNAEMIIKRIYPNVSAIERGLKIEQFLTDSFGDDVSEEIIDLVFEHEFYPVGLNKNK